MLNGATENFPLSYGKLSTDKGLLIVSITLLLIYSIITFGHLRKYPPLNEYRADEEQATSQGQMYITLKQTTN